MITFRANLINYETIKKRTNRNQFYHYPVSFVQLNPQNKNDLQALSKIDADWDWFSSYAHDIKLLLTSNDTKDLNTYALTTQEKNFESLNPQKVLGLACVKKINPEQIVLEYLQVDPQNNYSKKNSKFKHIGIAIMNSLFKIYSGLEMILVSRLEAEPFYEKLGFKIKPNGFFYKKL